MDPLSLTASAIAILQVSGAIINLCYNYRSRVKSASKDAGRIISELNGLRSVIDILFQSMEAGLDSKLLESSAVYSLAGKGGLLERCEADLEELKKKLELGEGWKAVKAALSWPLRESDVRKVLREIDSTKSTLQLALAADQRKAIAATQSGITSLAQQLAANEISTRREKICRWLSAPNPILSYSKARKSCQPDTGLWLLNSLEFRRWKQLPKSFFWIYGIPGCGKTILSSTILEDLLAYGENNSEIALVYFYFEFNDVEKRTIESFVRSLVTQLFNQQAEASLELDKLFTRRYEGNQATSLTDLIAVFPRLLEGFKSTYLVIDAIDECLQCEDVLQFLRDIHAAKGDILHVLLTSRQLPEIEEAMVDLAAEKICIQDSLINEDITLYLTTRLKEDRKFFKWAPEVKQAILEKLRTRACGMFQWVVCQLETLRGCLTLDALQKELNTMPRTLEGTYEQILLRIDESYRPNAIKILYWLSFSARPLKVGEVVEMLAIDLQNGPRYNPNLKLLEPRDVMLMCSTLVTIGRPNSVALEIPKVHDDYDTIKKQNFEEIKLAHLSVKDYLMSDHIAHSKASIFTISPVSANIHIARTCLVYLLEPAFASGRCDRNTLRARLKEWPLLDYAAHYWPIHVRDVGQSLDDETWQLIRDFFTTKNARNGGNFDAWVMALTPDISQKNIRTTQPLYHASSFGMTAVVKRLLAEYPDIEVDAPGGRFGSAALQVACYRNHPQIVRVLLEAHADPTLLNDRKESCLLWAIMGGFTEVQRLLSQYGATDSRRDRETLDRVVVVP